MRSSKAEAALNGQELNTGSLQRAIQAVHGSPGPKRHDMCFHPEIKGV